MTRTLNFRQCVFKACEMSSPKRFRLALLAMMHHFERPDESYAGGPCPSQKEKPALDPRSEEARVVRAHAAFYRAINKKDFEEVDKIWLRAKDVRASIQMLSLRHQTGRM